MEQQTESGEASKGAGRWKTVLIVVVVVLFFLWASSSDEGYGGDCTSLGNGAEWGSDC